MRASEEDAVSKAGSPESVRRQRNWDRFLVRWFRHSLSRSKYAELGSDGIIERLDEIARGK